MRFNKFILVANPQTGTHHVLVGYVEFHKQLLPVGWKCLGGGLIDIRSGTVKFYGASSDFGSVQDWHYEYLKEGFNNEFSAIRKWIKESGKIAFSESPEVSFVFESDDWMYSNKILLKKYSFK